MRLLIMLVIYVVVVLSLHNFDSGMPKHSRLIFALPEKCHIRSWVSVALFCIVYFFKFIIHSIDSTRPRQQHQKVRAVAPAPQ
jgi:hypothetical protein